MSPDKHQQRMKVVGIGYNLMPAGCDDDPELWQRKDLTSFAESKYAHG